MPIWRLRACPKCHGDMLVDNDDLVGKVEACLQCGFIKYIEEVVDEAVAAVDIK